MAKKKAKRSPIIHAPDWQTRFPVTECQIRKTHRPFCGAGSEHPRVAGFAEEHEVITCGTCRKKLKKHAQWLNQLLRDGYTFHLPAPKPRKGPKADPRQVAFEAAAY